MLLVCKDCELREKIIIKKKRRHVSFDIPETLSHILILARSSDNSFVNVL